MKDTTALPAAHQFVERGTGRICTEPLFRDRMVRTLYGPVREQAPRLFALLTSARASALLAFLHYDSPLACRVDDPARWMQNRLGADPGEVLGPIHALDNRRKIFERKIRYWDCRPMDPDPAVVTACADARVLTGSFAHGHPLHIKDKFFTREELLGRDRAQWLKAFQGGDYALFRLTPDKYHYNHLPVTGTVVDTYEIDGSYHACNPGAVVQCVTPYSKNRRVVTILDTDLPPGGSRVGRVAMVEIVALMIGDIHQCYSTSGYDNPCSPTPGMILEKGFPKSLFRPGSSTTVLIFQKNRVAFCPDLIANQNRRDARSRFSTGFGSPLVETDIQVRQPLGRRIP
ncbi:MAG: phosphatidylserine decarboxylase [Desulfobacterales bacterium]|nr:phosphatidylserine decarboxylase [Desulfobacterales bacterium]